MDTPCPPASAHRTVLIIALANLAYFFVEIIVAQTISSVSLFADAIDFLEDTGLNLMVLIALRLSQKAQAKASLILVVFLLAPSLATLWTAFAKLFSQAPPQAFALTLTAMGALAVNLTCAFLISRFRSSSGSLLRAAYLSARNDAAANIAMIAAGLMTAASLSYLPDLVVGISILILNAHAAMEIFRHARRDWQQV